MKPQVRETLAFGQLRFNVIGIKPFRAVKYRPIQRGSYVEHQGWAIIDAAHRYAVLFSVTDPKPERAGQPVVLKAQHKAEEIAARANHLNEKVDRHDMPAESI